MISIAFEQQIPNNLCRTATHLYNEAFWNKSKLSFIIDRTLIVYSIKVIYEKDYFCKKSGPDKTKHCLTFIASKQQIINNLEQDTSNNEMTLTIAKQRMNNNPPPPSVNYNVYKVL